MLGAQRGGTRGKKRNLNRGRPGWGCGVVLAAGVEHKAPNKETPGFLAVFIAGGGIEVWQHALAFQQSGVLIPALVHWEIWVYLLAP